jgi:hypothetical protein
MPLYRMVAPNGVTYSTNGPEGATPEQIRDVILGAHPEAAKPPEAAPTPEKEKEFGGFLGTLGESVKTLGAADEAAAFAANPSEENRKKLIEATKSKYKSVGFGEGENWEAFKELLGGSLGSLAAPIAAATATGAVTGGIGAVPAAFATNTAQYEVQNLARQAQEQQRPRRPSSGPARSGGGGGGGEASRRRAGSAPGSGQFGRLPR